MVYVDVIFNERKRRNVLFIKSREELSELGKKRDGNKRRERECTGIDRSFTEKKKMMERVRDVGYV